MEMVRITLTKLPTGQLGIEGLRAGWTPVSRDFAAELVEMSKAGIFHPYKIERRLPQFDDDEATYYAFAVEECE